MQVTGGRSGTETPIRFAVTASDALVPLLRIYFSSRSFFFPCRVTALPFPLLAPPLSSIKATSTTTAPAAPTSLLRPLSHTLPTLRHALAVVVGGASSTVAAVAPSAVCHIPATTSRRAVTAPLLTRHVLALRQPLRLTHRSSNNSWRTFLFFLLLSSFCSLSPCHLFQPGALS